MSRILISRWKKITVRGLFFSLISLFVFSCSNIEDVLQKLEEQEKEIVSAEEKTEANNTENKPSEENKEEGSSTSTETTPPNVPSTKNDFNTWTPIGPSLTYNPDTDTVTVVNDYGTKTYPIARPGEIDSSKLLYQYCTPQEKYVYEAYVYAWKNNIPRREYYFKEPITADELREGYNAFVNDWPEAWNVSLAFQGIQLLLNGEWKVIGTEINITLRNYESKKAELESALNKLRSMYDEKVQGKTSTEEKLLELFYLIRDGGTFGIEYDYTAGNGYSNAPGHTVWDLLVSKKGVCEGFGKLFSFVAHRFDLEGITALGGFAYDTRTKKDAGHVWNAIRDTNGKWHQVDPTWNQWKTSFNKSQHRLTGASAKWFADVNK